MTEKEQLQIGALQFKEREYKPNDLYLRKFLDTLEHAEDRIFDNVDQMRVDSIELIADTLIQFIDDDKEKKEAEDFRKSEYTRLKKERMEIFGYKSEEELDKPDKDLLWKKACIASIGKVLNYHSKWYAMKGYRLMVGIGTVSNGKTALVPIDLLPDEIRKRVPIKTMETPAEEEEITPETEAQEPQQ